MLTLVEARSPLGSLLSMPMGDTSSGIYIGDIEGLGPVKATLVSSSFAGEDGEQYHSMRREARDVKLTLGLEPDYVTTTVRALRARLYQYFMTGMPINLRFYDQDGPTLLTVGIDGRVETCEPVIFGEEPGVEVGIRCFKPDFLELVETSVAGNTVSTNTDMTINYTGTVETGIIFTMTANRAVSDFTIYHTPADGTVRTLYFATPLANGDKVVISTVAGSKYARLTLSGQSSSSSILRGVSPQSNWIELQPGPNLFRVQTAGAAVPWNVKYTNRHGGL
jgi:hypothetical protein